MKLCDSMASLAMMYADDELAVADRHEVSSHAELCVACAAVLRDALATKRELTELLARPAIPSGLWTEVQTVLDSEDRKQRSVLWKTWILPAPAIAAAACALVLFGLGLRPAAEHETVAHEAVRLARTQGALEVQGASTVPWIEANFQPVAMTPAAKSSLFGAKLAHLLGRPAAALHFKTSDGNVVMYVVKGISESELQGELAEARGKRRLFVQSAWGQATVATVVAGNGYVITSPDVSLGVLIGTAERLLPVAE